MIIATRWGLRLGRTSWVLLLILAAAPAFGQQAVQRIAAVVNQDAISTHELSERIELAILASGLPDDATTRQRIAPQVLRSLIDERLQLQEARRLNLDPTQEEIDRALADVAQGNNLQPEQLEQILEARNIAPRVLRDQIRGQVAWFKVIARQVRPQVVVSREQVSIAMQTRRPGDVELLVSEILLPVYDPEQERQVLQQAQELVGTLRAGAPFDAVARQLSAAPSAEAGGSLGWIPLSSMAQELQSMFAALQAGDVSQPVRTPAGVQIFKVVDRRALSGDAAPAEADRDAVRERLQREQLNRLAQRYLRDLRRSAFIDVRI
jgi:peptidyl-prolyl cis-trans isomerase SurA